MAKTMTVTWEGKKYLLEFTRDTVRQIEQTGFNVDKAMDTPLSSTEILFTGAFLAHEADALKAKIPEKILDHGIDTKMLGALKEMYDQPIRDMFSGEGDDKNPLEWETDF